ncbi:MAG: response regulator [Cellvibrionaceae bacterium]|nr:response regulator [Cellvibrionaceae bacterium]
MSALNIAILIVDDDSTSLEMSAAIVESLGVEVDKADSGRKAIAMCGAKPYGVILMDLEMPEVDGYKTTKAIKSMKTASKDAIIVALTATLSSKEQVVQCLKAGMKDCMVKPLTVEDLKVRFEKWGLM